MRETQRVSRLRRAGDVLTVVCLEGLGFEYLTAVAAHDQVEVILGRTLAKDGHVCENTYRHSLASQNVLCSLTQHEAVVTMQLDM